MALVGHAEILVKAVTRGVEADIKRAFGNAAKSVEAVGADMGRGLARGMNRGLVSIRVTTLEDKLNDALRNSVQLAEGFTSLARKGYFVQGIFGALAGSIAAVVGGLGALAGAAGLAAGSLVAVGSAGIQAMLGTKVLGMALSGIGQAVSAATKQNAKYAASLKKNKFAAEEAALSEERAALNLDKAREAVARTMDLSGNSTARREAIVNLKEAELALRKAKSAESDLASGGGVGAGVNPFANLTKSQTEFAKFLVSIQPKLKELKEAVASGFLPILETQIKRLLSSDLFPMLKKRLYEIGQGGGLAAKAFTDMILATENLKDFDSLLRQTAESFPIFGRIISNLFGGFLSVIAAAEPITDRFIAFLDKKSQSFANFLNTKQATGELETFFKIAGDTGAKFGAIFGNLFKDLGDIIVANFGPNSGGQKLLDWLKKVSDSRFDMQYLTKYFSNAADNFIAMGDALGGAVDIIVRTGSNPAVGQFWKIMDTAAYSFNIIVTEAVRSGPAVARVLSSLVKIFAQIADAGQAIAFFDTLAMALNGVLQVLRSIKPFFDTVGPFFGALSAVGLLTAGFIKFTGILLGFGAKFLNVITKVGAFKALIDLLPASLLKFEAASKTAGTAATLSLGGVGIAIAAIVAAISAVVVGFNAIGAANMDKAVGGIGEAFDGARPAMEVWGQALLSQVDSPIKDSLKTMSGMKLALKELGERQGPFEAVRGTLYTTALADSFGALGRELGNIATTDLPTAQQRFRSFTQQMGFTKNQTRIALNEMDEFNKALIEQADALGVSIRKTDGTIDKTKFLSFALGDSAYAAKVAKKAHDDLVTSLQTVTLNSQDYRNAFDKNKESTRLWAEGQAKKTKDATDSWQDFWDGHKFNLKIYLDDLEKQMEAEANWASNLKGLTKFLPDAVIANIKELGPEMAPLAKELLDKLMNLKGKERDAFIKRIERLFGDAATTAVDTFSNGFNFGFKKQELKIPWSLQKPGGSKDGGFIGVAQKFGYGGYVSGAGTARSDSIPAMLSNGEYVVNARATAQNRQLLEAINQNKSIKTAPNVNIVVNPSPGMDEREIAAIVSRRLAFEIRKGSI